MPPPPNLLNLAVLATLMAVVLGVQVWYWRKRRRTRLALQETQQIEIRGRELTTSGKLRNALLIATGTATAILAIWLEDDYGRWIIIPLAFGYAVLVVLTTYLTRLLAGDPVLRRASRAMKQDPGAAAEMLQRVVDNVPQWAARRWIALGWSLVRSEEYYQAVDAFDNAAERATRSNSIADEVTSRVGYVVAQVGANEPEMALEAAEDLIRRLPDEPGAHYARALSLHAANRADEAAMAMKIGDDVAELAGSNRTLDPLTQSTIRALALNVGAGIGRGFQIEARANPVGAFGPAQSSPPVTRLNARQTAEPHREPDR